MVILCSLTAISANESNDTVTTESDSLNELESDNIDTSSSIDTYSKPSESVVTKNIQKNNKNVNSIKTSSDVGTRDELEKLLNNTGSGSTVYLEKDYDYNTSLWRKPPIIINKTLTIDGKGHTLNGLNSLKFFEITADNVVLRNITFINGFCLKDSEGVAIDWLGNNGVLEDCIFKDCIPRSESAITGLVYVKGNSLTAKNCYFENNAAFRGAGFYLDSNNNRIINCTFNNNNGYIDDFDHRLYFKYSAGSGIFINGDNNLIDKCVFINQSTVYGTIFVDGEKNIIKNSTFRNNTVYRDGGAIYINKAKNIVTGCIIEYNTAKVDGGAIYINDKNNEIYDCLISNNFAKEGGAIYINKQDNKVYSCIIYDNKALEYGGAIYVDAKNNKINNNIIYLNSQNYNIISRGPRNDIYSSVRISADKNWWGNVNTDICDPLDSVYMKNKNVKPTTNNNKVSVNTWYYLDVVDKFNNTIKKNMSRLQDTFDFKLMFKLNSGKGDFNYPYFANEFNLTGQNLSLFDGVLYKDKLVKGFEGDSLAFNMFTNNTKSYLKIENYMFGIEIPFTFKETYPLSKLQKMIDKVHETDTVILHENYKYDPVVDKNIKEGLLVKKTMTIDGNGYTIDCDKKVRGFYVTADDVQFKNIIIKNGKAENGAAITFNGNGGIVNNSTFNSNFAEADGGAIFSYGENTFINNSRFNNNYAADKGAALYSMGKSFRYSNNIFSNNQAKTGKSICVEGPYYYSFSGWDNNTYHNNTYLNYGGDNSNNKTANPTIRDNNQRSALKSISQRLNEKRVLTSNNKEIKTINNYIVLESLNEIFNMDFRNGHLLVYIDGKLVFNGTTTDDLTQIIYDLLKILSGNHEIRVEFTDNEGNTNSYAENITV